MSLDPVSTVHGNWGSSYPSLVAFSNRIAKVGNVPLVGAGGYVRSDRPTKIIGLLSTASGPKAKRIFQIGKHWSRIGMTVGFSKPGTVRFEVHTSGQHKLLEIWGLACGSLELPEPVLQEKDNLEALLNSSHLSPETLYLPHEEAIGMDFLEEDCEHASLHNKPGGRIDLKKCAYCQRHLPIDLKRPSTLAFHKHNAKKTKHQNECRSCKKWRINNSFNPRRTVDQFHESSVISRERKLFLREPEILQAIKDREGAGLKSIVWKRFDKKCFYCKRSLALSEVQLDHTRPMAYLYPIDEHATCLCDEHNNYKKDKFPVDVYNEDQLRKLSGITKLPLEELKRKDVNQVELDRILGDIETYARIWDPRTFNSTARKVIELRPKVDLFEVLKTANKKLYDSVCAALQERPS